MQPDTIKQLLTAYIDGTISRKELPLLQQVLADKTQAAVVQSVLETLLQATPPAQSYDPRQWDGIAQNILAVDRMEPAENGKSAKPSHRIHFLKTSWFRYAAAVLLLVGSGFAIRSLYHQKKAADIARRIQNGSTKDVPPGGNKAVLTLADGTTIVLDTAANGQLAQRGNIQIIKLQNGQLKFVINPADSGASSLAYRLNTVTTPRGGQYQLELPDGTHIWLNAATAFTFPTAFTGSKRQVQLEGEAYFEVAEDAAHPFEVAANGTTVKVLGTHFNVNAYPDEKATTTTLLKGKVQVQTGSSQLNLLPGYQSRSANGSSSLNQHANTEEAVAWKEGYFQFSGADIQTIMRQIGRWYNVDIQYAGDVSLAHLTGEIPRTLPLRQVMEVLKESGISVWLEDNDQLYVAPAQ